MTTSVLDTPAPHISIAPSPLPLDALFSPRAVAVIGATDRPGSVGKTLLSNLLQGSFRGHVFPVNPKRAHIMGLPAYPSIADVPASVDLAVIATPAATVPELIAQCAKARARAAVILTAGFAECGASGKSLQDRISAIARDANLRVLGPNCLGIMNPHAGLNATFAAGAALPGRLAFLSQSGALCTAVLDWSLRERLGFSAIVSTGAMIDVGWGELIRHLGDDPHTHAILLYMESIGDAASFMSAARAVAPKKPIVVLKAGRSHEASRAAASHTGAMTGSDDVLDALFRRAGVLRAHSIGHLFSIAELLARQPRAHGARLAIVTNAGGPGILATDALIAAGGTLAPLAPESIQRLNDLLPPWWSHANPIDVLGDADPHRFAQAVRIAAQNPETDGVLAILTPQAVTNAAATAAEIAASLDAARPPVLASWMGGDHVQAGIDALTRQGIPCFPFPEDAAAAFCSMAEHAANLRALHETAAPVPPERAANKARVADLLNAARARNCLLLDAAQSLDVVAAYGIPIAPSPVARTSREAVEHADALHYPVVLKLCSGIVTHKADIGGVALHLPDAAAVRRAFEDMRQRVIAAAGQAAFAGAIVQPMLQRNDACEVILGSAPDPQAGPVLLFGAGGALAEILNDKSLGLPPLDSTLALRMIERTRIARTFAGVRGRKPLDLPALQAALVHFSHLVLDHPCIREIEINPLVVSPDGLIAIDARLTLYPPQLRDDQLPHPIVHPVPRA
ncbi:MAG TPA: acetate--CoA ligase family protein [Phycisphaerae bacterium]|nr:acetate--CoA ligase family protein [Phycisphaerae bacterium]